MIETSLVMSVMMVVKMEKKEECGERGVDESFVSLP